jgi:uncharacterized protein
MTVKKNEVEKRSFTSPIEIRKAEEDPEKRYIVGYALRFNSESNNLGGFVEKIDPSALEGANLEDVRALFNHDANQVLGRTRSGTLKLDVDEFGLKYTIDPPDTTFARDLMSSMARGDIDQSSFGFMVDYENDGDEWERDEQRGLYVRTIKRFSQLFDVSVVTYPAYDATQSMVAQRSLDLYKQQSESRSIEQDQIEIELDLLSLKYNL